MAEYIIVKDSNPLKLKLSEYLLPIELSDCSNIIQIDSYIIPEKKEEDCILQASYKIQIFDNQKKVSSLPINNTTTLTSITYFAENSLQFKIDLYPIVFGHIVKYQRATVNPDLRPDIIYCIQQIFEKNLKSMNDLLQFNHI